MRSFIAASTTTKVLASPAFTRTTRVTRTPALPTMSRPGSKTKRCGEVAEAPAHQRRVALGMVGLRVLAGGVGDAEAAAEVDVVDGVAVVAQRLDEAGEDREGWSKGARSVICEPMCMSTPGDGEAGQPRRLAIDGARARDGDAELVLRLAGGDLGVRQRVDVGVDAQRHARGAAPGGGDRREGGEFRLRLDVEAENVLVERERDLAPSCRRRRR